MHTSIGVVALGSHPMTKCRGGWRQSHGSAVGIGGCRVRSVEPLGGEPNEAMAFGSWVPSFTHFEFDSMLVCPPPLDRVDDVLPGVWADLAADDSRHPLIRARLADLLSVLGHGDRFEFAKIAVCGYLAVVADVAIDDLERMVALKRIAYLCSGLDNACLLQIVGDAD